MRSPRWATSRPMSVSAISPGRRSTSSTPRNFSRSRICMDSAGCVTAQASAARPKWPCSAKAPRYRSCLKVITAIRYYYREPQAIRSDLIRIAARRPSGGRPKGSLHLQLLRRVLDDRPLVRRGLVFERGRMRHGDDIVAGIHEVDLAGDAGREVGEEIERGAPDLVERDAAAQRRMALLE